MNEQIESYLSQYPQEIMVLFQALRQMILDSAPCPVEEKMWTRLPSYYAGDRFVRLIPFKDHINVEAAALSLHREALTGCKLTPKGMLQIRPGQAYPRDILARAFQETLAA